MTAFDLAAYILILLSVTLAPGPLIAIIVARTMGKDAKGALAITLGMASGDVLIIALIYMGFATVLQSAPELMQIAKIGGMIYLFWLAYDMWFPKKSDEERPALKTTGLFPSALFGFASCFVTPHSVLLYLLLLPQLMDITQASVPMITLFCALTFGALVLAFSTVILVTAKVQARTTRQNDNSWINRILATCIAGSGVWMMTV